MNKFIFPRTLALIAVIGFSFASHNLDAKAQGYSGTGDNFGSGWQSDGNGGLRGTGDNFGSGYRRRD